MNMPAEQVSQAQTVALPKRWPLVSRFQARSPVTPLFADARIINGYAEYDPEDKQYWIFKRFGLSPAPLYSTAHLNGFGCYTSPAQSIFMFVQQDTSGSAYLYIPAYNNAVAPVATLDGSAPYYFETVDSSPQTVVMANGQAGYVLNLDTFAVTHITDANYPPITVPGFVYLDGTTYIMDYAGSIWGTAGLDNALVWSGTNVIKANSNADQGVALVKQLNYIIALKQVSAQVFFDNGNTAGSPLSPVPDSQIPLGCASPISVQSIDDIALWMTSNETISPQVVKMENLTPKIVSTPAIERILDEAVFTIASAFYNRTGHDWVLNPAVGISSWSCKHAGHRFYGLNVESTGLTLVYDIDEDLWYVWQFLATGPNATWWPVVGMSYFSSIIAPGAAGIHYAQHASNGNIYQMDADYAYPNDYGNQVIVDIYTPNLDFGTTRRKTLDGLFFRGDRVEGYLGVRYSDDDYKTWSNFRKVYLGGKKPRLMGMGSYEYRRALNLRYGGNTAFRISAMDLQMDIGTA